VTFVSASAQFSTDGGPSLTIAAPTTIVAGNLLLAAVGMNTATPGVSAPVGWTPVGSYASADNVATLYLWKRVAASEPASYTFTGGSWLAGTILQYAGAAIDGADVAWAAVSDDSSANDVLPVAAATPSTPSDVWVVVVYSSYGVVCSTPTGFLARSTAGVNSGDEGILAFDQNLYSLGSTGTTSVTFTPSDSGVSLTVLLAGGSGGGTGGGPPTPPAYLGTPGIIPVL
jgi:hypothetical protein